MKTFLLTSISALAMAGCTALPREAVSVSASSPEALRGATQPVWPAEASPSAESAVGSTILPGTPPRTAGGLAPARPRLERGSIRMDFRAADVSDVARAVLGGILQLPYSVSPGVRAPITLRTQAPVSRAAVLPLLETALRDANLALVPQPEGGFRIMPLDQARAAAPVAAEGAIGFTTETVRLQFVDADELRRVIDPVLPGVVTGADSGGHTLTLAGSEGQRASARDLVRQFDVNWLRGASFGLFIPHRTDSRLIAPELDRVLNADGSPTNHMVRLIAMDRINGILAVSTQAQYLEDVRRWIEILDREGVSNARKVFVYRVQNGRASDLARTLASVFGQAAGAQRSGPALGFDDHARPAGVLGGSPSDGFSASGASASASAMAGPGATVLGGPTADGRSLGVAGPGQAGVGPSSTPPGGAATELQADDFHIRVTSDDVNNAIVMYGSPRDYAVVEDALHKLDVAPMQVMIEAAITEVTLNDLLRFGVQGLYNNRGTSVGLTQSAAGLAPTQLLPGFNALYTATTIQAALTALESLSTVKVVSAPKLLVLNNQTASIEVGRQIPILTGSATSVITSNAPIVNSVDYRDTGILLKVTPRVNSSGLVLLDLAQEVSDVIAAGADSTINSPSISTRRIATSVAVQDGQIVALGGLIRDNRNDSKSGLPLLSRVPILGPLLFGQINNDDERTELVVLLRPRVVRNVDDGRAVTEELRDKLQALRTLLPPGRIP